MWMRLGTWLSRPATGWEHLQQVPFRRLAVMLAAVFLLFSVTGFYYDLMDGGTLPYPVVLGNATVGGFDAALWVLVLARAPAFWLIPLALAQPFSSIANRNLAFAIEAAFHPRRVTPVSGIHFASTATLLAVLSSYGFFVLYIRIAGREAFRLRTELDLAHSIQKTLVPPISRIIAGFEIYGVSEPSEKVGGDLVDVVVLHDGDTVAYLADIAGHGLQAGILMGMLKTAARTALLDDAGGEGGATLSMLMERLNQVLPGVKEAHMYATFTALRLNRDGQVFYGMAASPPLLHWVARERRSVRVEEGQFPLGLLPVSGFTAVALTMAPGDLVVVATDGLLEVCANSKAAREVEFGIGRLEELLASIAERPLPELASSILHAVRKYGRQVDDQTLLLVRRCLE